MFKRVRWVSLGVVIGFGGSVWAQRKARALAGRVLPDSLAERAGSRARAARRPWPQRAGSRARAVGDDLRGALSEGRQAMREREHELRAQLDPVAARRRRQAHPSAAHDHVPASAPHLHLVETRTAEEQGRRR